MVVVSCFCLTSFINRRALSNAIVVAFPDDVGICREGKHPFDRFPAGGSQQEFHESETSHAPYRILMLRPPSIFVQTLNTSSPLRTLRTAPQTSSPASANWSPTMARRRSSQYRSATPFFNLTTHFPPFLFSSSSHTGRIPFLKIW